MTVGMAIPSFSIAPEFLLLVAGGIWVICGAISGLFAPPLVRVEAGLLFILLGVTVTGAAISVFLPAGQAGAVLVTSIIVFAVLPLVSTTYLLTTYPKQLARRQRAGR